jgi:serine protease
VRIVLTIAEDNHTADDLDLFLLDNGGTVLQVSEARNTGIELLETAAAGTFLVGVRAFAGASAYTLSFRALSSLPSDAGVEIFPPGVEIVPSEVVVKRKTEPAKKALDPSAFASKHRLTLSAGNPADVELMKLDPSQLSEEDAPQQGAGALRTRQKKEHHETSERNALRSRTYDAIRRLRLDPDVEYAHSNYRLKPRLIPNDGFYPRQWHYDQIALAEAWDVTTGSDTIIVAVIDTGVVSHPDLQARTIAGYDFINDPAVAGDGDGRESDPTDAGDDANGLGKHSYHGTHVAGTIGAVTNNGVGVAGVTWQTKIMPLRVLGKGGGSSFDLAEALKYAAGLPNLSGTLPLQRAHLINLSRLRRGRGYSAKPGSLLIIRIKGRCRRAGGRHDFGDGCERGRKPRRGAQHLAESPERTKRLCLRQRDFDGNTARGRYHGPDVLGQSRAHSAGF